MAAKSLPKRARTEARSKSASPAEIAGRLFARKIDQREGFTREQLRRALVKLFEICPSAEVQCLHWAPSGEFTYLVIECPADEAAALVGRKVLPMPPRRVSYYAAFGPAAAPWLSQIRRTRNRHFRIYATVADEHGECPLAAFSPSEIRKLAPEGPQTTREWKDCLRESIPERDVIFCGPVYFENFLRRPLFSSVTRRGESFDTARSGANSRFRLREADVQRMVAVFTRLHEQLVAQIIADLDSAQVEDRTGKTSNPLSLAVDNTRGRP